MFPIPHLTTVLQGPLPALEQRLLDRQLAIEAWFRQQFRHTPPPFYASVDLRNAEFKLAPIDTNLFPAGFNNLNPDSFPLSIHAIQATLEKALPGCINILLIPESHTRNSFYFENIHTLKTLLVKAGFCVRMGSLIDDLKKAKTIELTTGDTLVLEPLVRHGDRLMVADFNPCLILLNNDLSSGIPPLLTQLVQPVMPSLQLGWSTRTKTGHFAHYAKASHEFAELIDLDPWLIAPLFTDCKGVDFTQNQALTDLIEKTADLLGQIQAKYQHYEITKKPFVTIKSDTGTYGRGVIMVDDAAMLKNLTRKLRKEMAVTKGGGKLTQVIIQEGVYTSETWGEENFTAEPVVYLIGQYVVGGFYRIHPNRGNNQNLNSPGMQFMPLAFAKACNNPDDQRSACDFPNRFYAYGVIARLALVAAAREMAALCV